MVCWCSRSLGYQTSSRHSRTHLVPSDIVLEDRAAARANPFACERVHTRAAMPGFLLMSRVLTASADLWRIEADHELSLGTLGMAEHDGALDTRPIKWTMGALQIRKTARPFAHRLPTEHEFAIMSLPCHVDELDRCFGLDDDYVAMMEAAKGVLGAEQRAAAALQNRR